MQKITFIILIIFCLVASFLRLDGTVTKSFAFTYDVGRDMLALNSFAHGHITLIGFTTGLPGVFYGPWWYVLLLPVFILSGGNPVGVAGFLACIGVATVVCLYILGRKIGNQFLALTVLALAAVSPKLIALSSQIWNPNIAPLWMALLLFIIRKISIVKDKQLHVSLWLIAGLLIGLLFESEIVFGTLFFIGFVIFIFWSFRRELNIRRVMSFALGWFIILSPRVLFELRHNFLMTKAAIAFFSAPSAQQKFDPSIFTSRAQFILSEWSNTVSNGNMAIGIGIGVVTLLIIGICWRKMNHEYQLFASFGLITTSAAYIILLGFHHDLWGHYLVGYPIVWIILVGIALSLLFQYLSKPVAVILAVALVVYNLSPVSLVNRFTKPVFVGDAAVYRNQLAVIDTAYTFAQKQPFAYIVYTPPIQDYTYQYLFSWYGKKTYGYIPQGHPNFLMVIIEPDFDHPTLERDWIAGHAMNGKIILERKLASGIIVQKRITH